MASLESRPHDANRKFFVDNCGFFGGRSYEDVQVFITKVDEAQRATSVSSWITAEIVSKTLLRGEATLAVRRWDRDKVNFPNVSYWNGQEAVPYRPKVKYSPGIPKTQAIRAEPAVLATQCLRAYLRRAFT